MNSSNSNPRLFTMTFLSWLLPTSRSEQNSLSTSTLFLTFSHFAEQIHSSITTPRLVLVGMGFGWVVWVGLDIPPFRILADNFMPPSLSDRPGVVGGGIFCGWDALICPLLVSKQIPWLYNANHLLTISCGWAAFICPLLVPKPISWSSTANLMLIIPTSKPILVLKFPPVFSFLLSTSSGKL